MIEEEKDKKEDGVIEPIEAPTTTSIGEEVEYKGSFDNDFNNDFNRSVMAMKEKTSLKDAFCGINSLFVVKGGIEDVNVIDFDFDLPALVDSINYSEGEPTKNGVKVHGLDSDWCTMYEAGEATFSVDIPTAHTDVLELFWVKGEDVTATVNGASWKGQKYDRKGKQITLGIGILSADGTKLFIVDKVEAVASNIFESGSTQPHLVRVTGSVTSDNFVFLKKEEAEA